MDVYDWFANKAFNLKLTLNSQTPLYQYMLTFNVIQAEVVVGPDSTQFGPYIEGAGVDALGNFYATNGNGLTNQIAGLQDQTFELPNTELKFNGIKFVNDKVFYAVEMTENKIYKYDGAEFSVFCEHPDGKAGMANDLVLHKDAIYVSGNIYKDDGTDKDGQVWMCDLKGTATVLDTMGRTNGIAVNPEGTFLYVSEAMNTAGKVTMNKIWKYEFTTGEPLDGVPADGVPLDGAPADGAPLEGEAEGVIDPALAPPIGEEPPVLTKRQYPPPKKCSAPVDSGAYTGSESDPAIESEAAVVVPDPSTGETLYPADAAESQVVEASIGTDSGTDTDTDTASAAGIDVAGKTLVYEYTDMADFTQVDIDGMRFDVDGNLYVSRNGGSSISVFDKTDAIVEPIATTYPRVSNLEIIDSTIYATVGCEETYGEGNGCVETFPALAEGDIYTKLKADAYKAFA